MTDGQISQLVGEVWSQLPEDKRVGHMHSQPMSKCTVHWYDTNNRGCMLCIESIYAALTLDAQNNWNAGASGPGTLPVSAPAPSEHKRRQPSCAVRNYGYLSRTLLAHTLSDVQP